MKNGPLFLVGLFLSVLIAWSGIVLGSHAQLGRQTPFFDEGDGVAYPARQMGLAARGQLVYADLGCASCHTQQVRRPGFGNDQGRGWGERQSVARDYLFQTRPQLGASRFGPDLTNLGGRKPQPPTEEALYRFLYEGSPTHPPYAFLFENLPIAGEVSSLALKLSGTSAPASGRQIVPGERARTLVAYLRNLNTVYDYPESRPLPVEQKAPAKEEAKK
ncbi:MAG: cbb3-type cytochrome c oxidase subunit II [Verrucomicrobia bacterium]|jgi:cytochrome c oxidase cbb3-type subunit 2|nr:cbb3-type cytochrome c oxidase subunit II [Verrucomicrobiota bacterium]